jgi:hypothetical protein
MATTGKFCVPDNKFINYDIRTFTDLQWIKLSFLFFKLLLLTDFNSTSLQETVLHQTSKNSQLMGNDSHNEYDFNLSSGHLQYTTPFGCWNFLKNENYMQK